MKSDILFATAGASALLLCTAIFSVSCSGSNSAAAATENAQNQHAGMAGGPQLGSKGGGPVIDKSSDTVLQAMIKNVVPKFRQLEYKDADTGRTMKYSLFTPDLPDGATAPLVLFIADASTPGDDVTRPLTQGYGGLVLATDEWQSRHPCYVLVPQFAGVAVNDDYRHTEEVDVALRLVQSVAASERVDSNRLYTTGQSMGGMISMYYNVAYPDVFAASVFVDSHWDTSTFGELARHKFVYFIAGDAGKAYADLKPLEEACDVDGTAYSFAEWSARLPEPEQNALADDMLGKGAPVNIIQFEPGSVLPADGKGSEHMYSFDYAYRIPAVMEWLFRQTRRP